MKYILFKLTYFFIFLFLGLFLISTVDAQEKKKKKKPKIEITIGNDNKEDNDNQQSNKKSKKKKKKKSAEKLMYLILGSSLFSGAGEVQAISGKDIGNVLGVSTSVVNQAINNAYQAGAIYPTVYNDQYYISTNDLGKLMNYMAEYMDDDN